MAAYRLFNNEPLKLRQLYEPARRCLAELVGVGERAYVVHDFSVLDYSKHSDKRDRIQVGNETGSGYDLYAALVLDEMHRPVGPISVELQNAHGCHWSEVDDVLPFIDHLSQAERGIDSAMRHLAGRELVHVADREFDDVLLLRRLEERSQLYIIRALQLGRSVLHDGVQRKLGDVAKSLALSPNGTVERNGKRFTQHVAETTVTFVRPSRRGRKRGENAISGKPIDVRVVVTELRGIDTNEHYEWVLLANLKDPIDRIVSAYIARWKIERLFYLTKVGLRLESWRQQTAEAIARRLAVTMLAAMVIYQLQSMRDDTTLREIATRGGWLGRKNDSLGPVVLMRGMAVLLNTLDTLTLFTPSQLVELAEAAGVGFAVPAQLRTPSPRRPRIP
jgi:hypothetical protein